MAGEAIDIPIRFGGTDQAASGLERVNSAMERGGQRADALGNELESTTRAAQAAGRLFADLGRVIHDQTVAALGEFISRSAQSAEAGSRLGAVLGPQGALVGGIIGALLPAIEDVISASERQAQAQHEAAEAARREEQHVRSLTAALEDQVAQRQEAARLQGGDFASGQEAEDYIADQERIARVRQGQIDELERRAERVRDRGLDPAALERQIATLRAQMYHAEARAGIGEAGAQEFLQADIGTAAGAATDRASEQARQQGAEARRRDHEEQIRIWQEEVDFAAAMAEREQEEVDRQKAESQAALQREREYYAERQDARQHDLEAERQLYEEREAARLHDLNAEREALRARQEAAEADEAKQRERLERSRADTREFGGFVGEMNTQFIDAITQTIAGTQSAEDAFKALLKGFLEMIAQQAALKAAFEYGEAIASFARYDYASGAQHVAAGVAYTVVAVAAGVGAAALAPPAPPAEPTQSQSGGGGRSGDIIIQYNAPVVTAGTEAQLGRSLQTMIGRAQRSGLSP